MEVTGEPGPRRHHTSVVTAEDGSESPRIDGA